MSENKAAYVLDSFALLAYFADESGAGRVDALLRQASRGQTQLWMAVINLGEIVYIIEREQGMIASRKALAAVDQLPIVVVAADRDLTLAAAHVKAQHAVAYADAFAVALSQLKHAPVLTGDPEFEQVSALVKLEWLPQRRGE